MYTSADGLMGNGRVLESIDRSNERKPDIIAIVETKLSKNVRSHVVFLEICVQYQGKKKKKGSRGVGMALLVSGT